MKQNLMNVGITATHTSLLTSESNQKDISKVYTEPRQPIASKPPPSPSFNLSVTPAQQSILRDSSTTFKINITSIGAFNRTIYLVLTGAEIGVTYSFDPASVTLQAGMLKTSTLLIHTDEGAFPKTYNLMINALAPEAKLQNNRQVSLNVIDKTKTTILCSLNVVTISQGQSVRIEGQIEPNIGPNINITLESIHISDGWNEITKVETDSGGKFVGTWIPSKEGSYRVIAKWDGSSKHAGAKSSERLLTVTTNLQTTGSQAPSIASGVGPANWFTPERIIWLVLLLSIIASFLITSSKASRKVSIEPVLHPNYGDHETLASELEDLYVRGALEPDEYVKIRARIEKTPPSRKDSEQGSKIKIEQIEIAKKLYAEGLIDQRRYQRIVRQLQEREKKQ